MEKSEKLTLLKEIVIAKPCSANWEEMNGDEQVRMCSKCNMDVHNISAMNDNEAAVVLKKRKTERTCVFFSRKLDGSVLTDNCPKGLQKVRNSLMVITAVSLLTVAYAIARSATGAGDFWQLGTAVEHTSGNAGLVGAAIDPAFTQSNEFMMLANYGYDTARDLSRLITAVSFAVVFFFPMSRNRKYTIRRLLLELLALSLVPLIFHWVGTFIINNFGGLQGGV